MIVSNEIERPITVNIRPRKSRHGGVSTQIVSKNAVSTAKTPRKGLKPEPSLKSPKANEKGGGGIFKKVFGKGRA